MKAIVYTRFGEPEVLQEQEVARPVPGDGQVLVEVRASSLNVTEIKQFAQQIEQGTLSPVMKAMGKFALGIVGEVPGNDVAGVVVEVGAGATRFKKGDEVFGFPVRDRGAWAEYVCADEGMLELKPAGASFEEAACMPVAGSVALAAVRKAGVRAGQSVLVHGASGGVGHLALQIAKAHGASVTAVCGTRNVELAYELGADRVVDYRKDDVAQAGGAYDAVIAVNGYCPLPTIKGLLVDGGTSVFVGGEGRAIVDGLLGPILSIGSGRRLTSVVYASIRGQGLDWLARALDGGQVRPVLDGVFPLGEAPQAIRKVVAEHARGKTALVAAFGA